MKRQLSYKNIVKTATKLKLMLAIFFVSSITLLGYSMANNAYAAQYTITFYPMGGTFSNTTSSTTMNVNSGYDEDNPTFPGKASKTGYTFRGWYETDSVGNIGEQVFDDKGKAVDGSYWEVPDIDGLSIVDYYNNFNYTTSEYISGSMYFGRYVVHKNAITWTLADGNSYHINIDSYGFTVSYSTLVPFLQNAYASCIEWDAVSPSTTPYRFYLCAMNANGQIYYDFRVFPKIKWLGTSNLNVTASYTQNNNQIYFNPQLGTFSGTTNTTSKLVTYDSDINNAPGIPTRSGYTFGGWYTQENGGSQMFDSNGDATTNGGYWSEGTIPITIYSEASARIGPTIVGSSYTGDDHIDNFGLAGRNEYGGHYQYSYTVDDSDLSAYLANWQTFIRLNGYKPPDVYINDSKLKTSDGTDVISYIYNCLSAQTGTGRVFETEDEKFSVQVQIDYHYKNSHSTTIYFNTMSYRALAWAGTNNQNVYAKWTKSVSSLDFSNSPSGYIYDGTAKCPTVSLYDYDDDSDNEYTLTSGTDYTYSCSNNTNVGTASISITGNDTYNSTSKAYYTGSSSAAFSINNARINFNANGGTLIGSSYRYTRTGSSVVYTGIRNSTTGSLPSASNTGSTFNGWYTIDGTKVLNADGSFASPAVSGYTKTVNGNIVWDVLENKTTAQKQLYAEYTPDTPVISDFEDNSGFLPIYASNTNINLTCTVSTTYSDDVDLYYSYGYAASRSDTPGNWTSWTLNDTLNIPTTSFVDQRYYACRVRAVDEDNNVSGIGMSDFANSPRVVIKNAKLTFDATTNGGTGGGAVYTRKGESSVFSAVLSVDDTTTIPTVTPPSGYILSGWYDASSGGNKVLNSDGTFTGTAVTDYTTTNTWDMIANKTLYAQYQESVFTITLDKQSGSEGTNYIYEKYATGYYLENACTNQMTTSTNGITPPTRTGYTFSGYYTQTNGEGTQYIDSSGKLTNSASYTQFSADGTLYAYWSRGLLSIEEKVKGNQADTSKEFSFTINVKDTNNNNITGTYAYTGSKSGNLTFTSGNATFTLHHDQYIEIYLPTGYTYTITQTNTGSYTLTKSNDTGTIGGNEDLTIATFTDTLSSNVPTGLFFDIIPYLILAISSIGSMFLINKFKNI